ncbi:putative transmembrane protein [Phytophthora cinnamomi]|nr:putative transmembrane protein [Phytophthora cinnamomi]
MDANLALLMSIKLVLIGLNLLPLLLAAYIPPVKQPDTGLKGVERALAIRASNVGGLGSSLVYIYGVEHKGERRKVALNSYELVRLGYVVFGGQFLLTFDAWDVIMNTAVLHRVHHLWNYRVVLFPLRQRDGYAAVGDKPVVCRLDDARLDLIPFWDIAAQPVKC